MNILEEKNIHKMPHKDTKQPRRKAAKKRPAVWPGARQNKIRLRLRNGTDYDNALLIHCPAAPDELGPGAGRQQDGLADMV